MKNIEEKWQDLLALAERSISIHEFEEECSHLVAAAKVDPAIEEEICKLIEVAIRPDSGCIPEVIRYFTHIFRWKRVQDQIKVYLSSAVDPRMRDFYEQLMKSFGENWEDKSLFPTIGKHTKG